MTPVQQRQVLVHFQDLPVALELGFKEGEAAWAKRLGSGYLAFGIKPVFITANAFDGNNKPTPEQWDAFSRALRDSGLPASTLILPTFEYANFAPNMDTLVENTVSKRRDFQDIIKTAGGIVLDAPPGYAFGREENYRVWVIDAMRWTSNQGLEVVWITSPHTFPHSFRDDTERFLRYLEKHGALPTIIVSENYEADPPKNYPGVVGHEDAPDTPLGVAWCLLNSILPKIADMREPDRAVGNRFSGSRANQASPAVGNSRRALPPDTTNPQ